MNKAFAFFAFVALVVVLVPSCVHGYWLTPSRAYATSVAPDSSLGFPLDGSVSTKWTSLPPFPLRPEILANRDYNQALGKCAGVFCSQSGSLGSWAVWSDGDQATCRAITTKEAATNKYWVEVKSVGLVQTVALRVSSILAPLTITMRNSAGTILKTVGTYSQLNVGKLVSYTNVGLIATIRIESTSSFTLCEVASFSGAVWERYAIELSDTFKIDNIKTQVDHDSTFTPYYVLLEYKPDDSSDWILWDDFSSHTSAETLTTYRGNRKFVAKHISLRIGFLDNTAGNTARVGVFKASTSQPAIVPPPPTGDDKQEDM